MAVRDPVPRAGAAAAPSHAARAGTAQPRLGDGPAPRGEPAQPAAEGGLRRRRRARPDLARARRRRRAQRPGGRARGDLLPADRGGQRIRHLARRAGAPLEAGLRAGAGRQAPGGPGEPAVRLAGRTRRPDAAVAGTPGRLRAPETLVRGLRPGRGAARGCRGRHAFRLVRDAHHGRREPAGRGRRDHGARPDRGLGRPGPDRLRPGLGYRSAGLGAAGRPAPAGPGHRPGPGRARRPAGPGGQRDRRAGFGPGPVAGHFRPWLGHRRAGRESAAPGHRRRRHRRAAGAGPGRRSARRRGRRADIRRAGGPADRDVRPRRHRTGGPRAGLDPGSPAAQARADRQLRWLRCHAARCAWSPWAGGWAPWGAGCSRPTSRSR